MRKNYSNDFKAKVAIEMIREHDKVAEIASKYQAHRTFLTRWKREAIEGLPGIFQRSSRLMQKIMNSK